MKRLAIIIPCIFLLLCSSCSPKKEYSLLGKALDVTFEDGDVSTRGILVTGDDFIEFSPETPSGLVICITEEGGSVSWGSLRFEDGVVPSSRLMPLFEALQSNDFTMTFGKAQHPHTVEGDGFKIKIHKEISSK